VRLRIALAQLDPGARCPEGNLRWALDAIQTATQKRAKIICLPELFPYGLLPNKFLAENAAIQAREFLHSLKEGAQANNIVIFAGLPWPNGDRPYNSLLGILPKGGVFRYDKLHLFPLFNEHESFSPGNEPVFAAIEVQKIKAVVGLMICYDIRFPELARRYSWSGCNLLVVSALWPQSRKNNFITLLRARALENQCYIAASNACGSCKDVQFAGSSLIVAPNGSLVCQANTNEELLIADINLNQVNEAKSLFNSSWPQGAWNHPVEEKICSLIKLKEFVAARKAAGQKLVFTNGCFDILHAGHVSYLKKARSFGDFLVVGLNSDSSIRTIKGASRPVNPQNERATVLASLSFVDFVVIFNESTPEKLIHELEPDILVKGADWPENQIVGANFVKSLGGRIERIPFEKDTSTTKIIKRLQDL